MSKFTSRALGIAACLALVSSTALAQSGTTISGTVKDTSGAVLPGVTVEAASPALIEKVRTSVTDSEGRYTIVDLRPGTYTVTWRVISADSHRCRTVTLLPGVAGFRAAASPSPG